MVSMLWYGGSVATSVMLLNSLRLCGSHGFWCVAWEDGCSWGVAVARVLRRKSAGCECFRFGVGGDRRGSAVRLWCLDEFGIIFYFVLLWGSCLT